MTASPLNFKFIIVGNSAVGKSCLLLRFDEDRFQPIHDVTVGVTFSIKTLQIDGQDIKVQIWDTAGQEIFRSITRSYYRDSNCAIIVYDITDRTSFEKIGDWVRDVRSLAPADCTIALVGNKLDLADDNRVVETSEGENLADEQNMIFYETSAATGENVKELFNACVSTVFSSSENSNHTNPKPTVAIAEKKPEKGCSC